MNCVIDEQHRQTEQVRSPGAVPKPRRNAPAPRFVRRSFHASPGCLSRFTDQAQLFRLTCNILTLATLVGLSGSLLAAAGARGASGLEQLERFLQGLDTLSAKFEQTVMDPSQGGGGYAQGTLYLQRPGRFRWEYRIPDQLVVADGKRVWMFDKELDQISHWGQESALKGTPALLLSDTGPLQDNFEVIEVGHRNGYEWAELRPRYEDSEFSRILLAFSEDQLKRMEIADNFGQITRFRFSDIRRNPGLDPALFRFDPPSGIDIFSE